MLKSYWNVMKEDGQEFEGKEKALKSDGEALNRDGNV